MRHLLPGFLAGEIDPLMQGRVDTDNYAYGLATCENFIALAQGPLVKRSGFEFIRDAAPTAIWLGAFRFSTTQEYVIEFSEAKARFYTNGGRIESDPVTPYEIVLPYTAAEAPALSVQQNYDRLYINHSSHAPGAIKRQSATTFAFETLTLKNGPFKDDNTDDAMTVTVAGTLTEGGAITITASSAIFQAGHVGGLFRMQAKDFADIKAWEAGMENIAIGDIVRSDGKTYTALTNGKTGSVQPTHTEGAYWDGQLRPDVLNSKGPYGVKWDYRHDKYGMVQITGFTSATVVTGTVKRRVPDSLTSVASRRWAHSCFSSAEGWPGLVTLWKGRRIDIKDFDLIGSVVGDYGGGQVNYSAFTDSGTLAADLSFRRTLATEDPPLWVKPDRRLVLGTASKELAVAPLNNQAALSGSNIDMDPQSFYGCEAVAPVQIGVNTIFVERGARRLRSSGYVFSSDRYEAEDITAAARHVTSGGLLQLAFQRVPWPMLFAVRGDGQLAVHSDTKLSIKGFARFKLGGSAQALSAVSVVGADGKSDELWVLVSRATPGGTRREIWRQTAWRELGTDPAQAFYVDGGVRASATGGQTHFTGLTHLAGQAVAVLAGGAVIPGMTVAADGSLDLPAGSVPSSAYTLVVGLAYTATATTLSPEVKTQSGSAQGLKQRVRKVVLRLLETMGLRVGNAGGTLDLLEDLDRSASDYMDSPIPLFSGDTQGVVETEYDRAGRITWTSSDPLPAIITAAMLSIDVDQRDA